MLSIESLFCPCCTPALLHTLAQTNLTRVVPQQMLWLGTGVFAATMQRQQKPSPQRTTSKNVVRASGADN